jgi:DNA-binding Lrp family transcriptional regulator
MYSPDALDGQIIAQFAREPRIGVLEASRRLGVARGTVQARLDRLEAAGVVTGWAPSVDPTALGFPVSAFATLEIAQGAGVAGSAVVSGGHEPVASHLRTIPEVLEAHTITGSGDVHCRIVARSNADLQRVIDLIVGYEGIVRASTIIALAELIGYRTLPLVKAASHA